MHTTQRAEEQPIDRKKMEDLHQKYVNSAKDAQKKGDFVLSETYYQRAEHCLHVMNEPHEPLDIPYPSSKLSEICDKPSDTQMEKKGKKACTRGSFLRHSRRRSQHEKEEE